MTNSFRLRVLSFLAIAISAILNSAVDAQPRSASGPGRFLSPHVLLQANDEHYAEFAGQGDLVIQKLKLSPSSQVFSKKLERLDGVTEDQLRKNFEIAPGRMVWAVLVRSNSFVQTNIGRFASGTMVLNIVDAASFRLLGFRVYGKLLK